ncbi:MAG: universal stress protein [Nitrospirae bacterium]|nr:universal stress protein [Nitrospirota bacterium]
MKILLATDGSEYSELATRFLSCLNLSPDDEITVFHVIHWYPLYYEREYYYETLKEIKREIAPKILDTAFAILKSAKAKISTAIEEDTPEQCIVEAADSSGMDLIVMGARGIKGIKSLFIGSVTRSVAHNSSKPVLVIKRPGCGSPVRLKILFATDGSDSAADTGAFLSELPFPDNTEIAILNVISAPFSLNIPEVLHPGINEHIMEIEAREREMEFRNSERVAELAREHLSKRFKKIEVLSEVGDPSTEILRVSETLKSDIIAVGCRGLRGLKGIMGSVSRNVLTHAKCSVLIGKMCK